MVFQWPCGTWAFRRCFRGPQPRKGSIFVFTQVSSMKTRRLRSTLACRAFHRVRLRATSGRVCSEATSAFFETEPLGVGENPDSPRVRLHAPLGQFHHQAAQRERRPPHARAQPVGDLPRKGALLVAADLASRDTARPPLPRPPLRNARRAHRQCGSHRADRLALLNPSQSPFPKIVRIGSRHACRPRSPANR
jgi:hypothetical protein